MAKTEYNWLVIIARQNGDHPKTSESISGARPKTASYRMICSRPGTLRKGGRMSQA